MVDVFLFTMAVERDLTFTAALEQYLYFTQNVFRAEEQSLDAPQVLNFTMEI